MKKFPLLFKLAIVIATLSITTPVVFSILLNNTIDISLTTLTLKKESCDFLQDEGMTIKRSHASDSICTLSIEYRTNNGGKGGVIYLGEREIHIAAHQIVATELADVKAAFESQSRLLVVVLLCLGFLLGTLLWLNKH